MSPVKPTMMEVATRAGVSQATVSLVLNGSPGARFSEATRRKVRQAADELGYRLIGRAQSGPDSDAKAIAFVADEITADPWMALAFEGAREKALEHGYSVTLAVARGGVIHDDNVLSQFLQTPLLGFIFGTILTRKVEPPAALFQCPSVLVNCYDQARRLPSVLPGDQEGGRAATERLIRAGSRRIGIINGQDGLDATRDRLRGYRQALASNDMSFEPDLVYSGNWEPQSGYEGTQRFLALGTPPDAIYCANDMMAVGCYEALKEAGLSIPQDVAVIGFDNREIAQFMRPPLTTLVLPQYEMGAAAAELLLDLAGGLKPRHDQIKVECRMIERESVGTLEADKAVATIGRSLGHRRPRP
ncbi:MAG: LacI family DNA-binding transcriptional regulator [Rhodobacter sp.]|nr:LacI family DNA-binding transcriptional regulator [Rhodobacter sp.]